MLKQLKQKFKALFDRFYGEYLAEYEKDPRVNSLGGVENPTDEEYNTWALRSFREAAEHLGLEVNTEVESEGPGDCYPQVFLEAVHPELGVVAKATYIDCICGDHGPRNFRLL